MKNEKKFDLTVTIENPKHEKGLVALPITLKFETVLYREQGNRAQYLYLESEQGGDLFNIPPYKDGYELSAITEWACGYWSGKNGAYKLACITLNGKESD